MENGPQTSGRAMGEITLIIPGQICCAVNSLIVQLRFGDEVDTLAAHAHYEAAAGRITGQPGGGS
jgi:hypothetical protein